MLRNISGNLALDSVKLNQSGAMKRRLCQSSPFKISFCLVLLSDTETHGVASAKWTDGSLSAPLLKDIVPFVGLHTG